MRLGAGERVAAGEARAEAERFRAGHDGPLHGARVGDEGVRREARAQRFEQVDVGGGGRREHEQLDAARDFLYTRGRVVHGAVLRRGGPLGGLGRPAEHCGHAGALRLPGERAADRAEADDAERGGTHGMEASGAARRRKREGRLPQEPPSRDRTLSSHQSFRRAPHPPINAGSSVAVGSQIPRHAPLASVAIQG